MRHHTLAQAVQLEGTGLHTGKPCRVQLLPRVVPGLVLHGPQGAVTVSVDAVQDSYRRIQLGGVSTLEHLLAALWVARVSAAEVVVEGTEIPALDGSALPFWNAVRRGGLRPLEEELPELVVEEPVWVQAGASTCVALPCAQGLRVTYVVSLRDRPSQAIDVVVEPDSFEKGLAPARTWGYRDEAESLWREGLALGASEANTLILERGEYRNPPRFPDEPVRHKVVDLLGDLALVGAAVRAHVVAVAAGHTTHLALARALRRRSRAL